MNKLRTALLLPLLLLLQVTAFAQKEVDMADTFRSNGKIYVVVTVCLIILLGLFVYLLVLDRKISGIEKEIEQ